MNSDEFYYFTQKSFFLLFLGKELPRF